MWNLILPAVTPIIDKIVGFIPNPNERAKAKEDMERELMTAVMAASQAQIEVNKIEAAHKSLFVAGWRPVIGYVCAFGLAWSFVIQPIAAWLFAAFLPGFPHPPQMQTDGLYQLVLAMLGMGGLRTYEKIKGVSREK